MKIKFLATGNAPPYEINSETINGLDLSELNHGDQFIRNETTDGAGIRDAYRDEHGQLWVTLKQAVGPGHWAEGDWIDASQYDPDAINVMFQTDRRYQGTPWAMTARGKVDQRTNEVIE